MVGGVSGGGYCCVCSTVGGGAYSFLRALSLFSHSCSLSLSDRESSCQGGWSKVESIATCQQDHLVRTCFGLAAGSWATDMVSMETGGFVSLPPNMAASWLPWLPLSSCSAVKVYNRTQ